MPTASRVSKQHTPQAPQLNGERVVTVMAAQPNPAHPVIDNAEGNGTGATTPSLAAALQQHSTLCTGGCLPDTPLQNLMARAGFKQEVTVCVLLPH